MLDASSLRPVLEVNWQGDQALAFSNEWVVRFAGISGSATEQLQAAQAQLGAAGDFDAVQYLGDDGLFLVRGPDDGRFEDYTQLLQQLSTVQSLEPNFLLTAQFVPNDTRIGEQWGLNNTGQTIQGQTGLFNRDVSATEAWDFVSGGSSSVIVAVLDTGVDYTHPDLNDNVFVNPGEVAGNGLDDDHNGFVDDVRGWDFTTPNGGDNDPMDTDGHGTHVAGIISAEGDNNQGIAGVAYGVKILPVKALSSATSGSTASAIAAMNYVSQLRDQGFNVRVVNNSYGTTGNSTLLQAAIDGLQSRGILFVSAAGNTGANNDVTPFYPASYANDNVISVAATDNRDNLWALSAYGRTSVDLVAPGVDVLSTLPNNTYGFNSGTSMAAAHVAGAAAWLWSVAPSASYQQIRGAILDPNAIDEVAAVGPLSNRQVATGGRLNMAAALGELTSLPLVIVNVPDANAGEEGEETTTGSFEIMRAGPMTDPLTVFFTITGTATNGVDYVMLTGSVTLEADETSATVRVTPIDDDLAEGNETVVLTLANNSAYVVGAPRTATVTISDDDVSLPVVTVEATDAEAGEPSDQGRFTVTRSGPVTAAMTVNFTVGGTATSGADYTALGTSATIPIGASSVVITVSPIDDGLTEPTETVVLTLAPGSGYALGPAANATVNITDNDANVPPDLQPIADLTVSGSQQVVIVPLSATDPNNDPITFTATAQNLAGLLRQQVGQLTYHPEFDNYSQGQNEKWFQEPLGQWYFLLPSGELGLWDGSATASGALLGVIGTAYYEVPSRLETALPADTHVSLSVVGNTLTVTRDLSWDSAVVITVTASDGRGGTDVESFAIFVTTESLPAVTVTAPDALAGEPSDQGSFTVTRTGPVTAALTVNFTLGGTATPGADYAAVGASVTIPAGASSATITLSPIDDVEFEASETVILSLTTGGYLAVLPRAAAVTITDNDRPTVTIVATDPIAAELNNNTGKFTVTRTGPTTTAMTVNFTVGGTATSGADYVPVGTSVTIPAGASSATITVSPIADSLTEPTESVVLTLASNSAYTIGAANSATVNIGDGIGVNSPPVLQPIGNVTVSSSQAVVVIPLSATDPDGDPVTFTATARPLAWVLTQTYGQFRYRPEYDNFSQGQNEKWFSDPLGQYYFLLPTGEFFVWDGGDGLTGTSLGRIGTVYYQDAGRLENVSAADAHATVSVVGNVLTVTRDISWDGAVVIAVTVSDGRGGTDVKFFTIFVSG